MERKFFSNMAKKMIFFLFFVKTAPLKTLFFIFTAVKMKLFQHFDVFIGAFSGRALSKRFQNMPRGKINGWDDGRSDRQLEAGKPNFARRFSEGVGECCRTDRNFKFSVFASS